jgi:tetratricopeptide (TPR) repeat protein
MMDMGVQKMATAGDELVRSAWEHYGKGDLAEAEKDFRLAIERTSRSIEAYYGLGVVLKVARRNDESIAAFERLLPLIESDLTDRSRIALMRRLVHGYLNLMRIGDWGLEKEIWKRGP